MKYYLTEKIWAAMNSGIIPIYWGDINCGNFFNKDSFIYIENYENKDNLVDEFRKKIDYIKQL